MCSLAERTSSADGERNTSAIMTYTIRAVGSSALVRPFDGVEIEDKGAEIWVWVERRIRMAMMRNTPPEPDPIGYAVEMHLMTLKNIAAEKHGKSDVLLWTVPDGSLPGPNDSSAGTG